MTISAVATTLAVLLVGACSRTGVPTRDEGKTSIAADLVRKAVAAEPDGGGVRHLLPAALENAPESLRGPLVAIQKSLSLVSPDSWQLMVDSAKRKERLAWLARDFGTAAFSRAERVDEAVLQTRTPEGALHLGLLVIHFRECKHLAAARAGVTKAGRLNLRLPVLTLFRTKAKGHDMIMVLSETPLHPQVDGLFKSLDGVLGIDLPCSRTQSDDERIRMPSPQ